MENQILISLTILLLGALFGAVVAWLLLKTRALAAGAGELATVKERLAGKEQEVQKLEAALNREICEHKKSQQEQAQLKAELEGERRAARERTESFKQAAEDLTEKFKALSRDALKDN